MKTLEPDHTITCVYCGMAYPENTPTHGKDVKVLTEHIKICEKHPMRALEKELKEANMFIGRLRAHSSHSNACHCRDDYDESCSCGYTKLIKEIEGF